MNTKKHKPSHTSTPNASGSKRKNSNTNMNTKQGIGSTAVRGREIDSEENLHILRKRVEYIEREQKYKEEVNNLQTSIQAAELESWRIKELIEQYKVERDFDWQLEQHGLIRALQAQII